jgi:hypothetical protein
MLAVAPRASGSTKNYSAGHETTRPQPIRADCRFLPSRQFERQSVFDKVKRMSLRFLTAGESHGPALSTIIEGMPAGVPVLG